MNCPKCGISLPADAVECSECGIVIAKYYEVQKKKVSIQEKTPRPKQPTTVKSKNTKPKEINWIYSSLKWICIVLLGVFGGCMLMAGLISKAGDFQKISFIMGVPMLLLAIWIYFRSRRHDPQKLKKSWVLKSAIYASIAFVVFAFLTIPTTPIKNEKPEPTNTEKLVLNTMEKRQLENSSTKQVVQEENAEAYLKRKYQENLRREEEKAKTSRQKEEKEAKIRRRKEAKAIYQRLLGSWFCDAPSAMYEGYSCQHRGIYYTFSEIYGKLIMNTVYGDGSSGRKEMEQIYDSSMFMEKRGNGHGEYYELERDGRLGVYDSQGLIFKMKK